MATLVSQSELVRRAIAHVSEHRGEAPDSLAGKELSALVEDACVRFNLSPLESEFLVKFFLDPSQGEVQED
ncbi:hypothetical protein [Megalodesulfovibrio gigas]|uniref:Uncharacterized protein n=1 Tax=Megalodesulfovibrio gigas (strain ATCC 19364 / DSM 1382 / NCIMB 9332 / VKM B-1759) TaxID=1121448 RepID=T2G5Y2_MEGG1|nr:hypothetical protein [Megalodesulfovibrio gigas]AGW11995.1 hypothetical protein DGI_0054 [Megalodesulfovibrio gigas DSM 1382 = ATCC 19364]